MARSKTKGVKKWRVQLCPNGPQANGCEYEWVQTDIPRKKHQSRDSCENPKAPKRKRDRAKAGLVYHDDIFCVQIPQPKCHTPEPLFDTTTKSSRKEKREEKIESWRQERKKERKRVL